MEVETTNPVHLYLIADPPTCFSMGRGHFYLLCDSCFAATVESLDRNRFSYSKETTVNAPCYLCAKKDSEPSK